MRMKQMRSLNPPTQPAMPGLQNAPRHRAEATCRRIRLRRPYPQLRDVPPHSIVIIVVVDEPPVCFRPTTILTRQELDGRIDPALLAAVGIHLEHRGRLGLHKSRLIGNKVVSQSFSHPGTLQSCESRVLGPPAVWTTNIRIRRHIPGPELALAVQLKLVGSFGRPWHKIGAAEVLGSPTDSTAASARVHDRSGRDRENAVRPDPRTTDRSASSGSSQGRPDTPP